MRKKTEISLISVMSAHAINVMASMTVMSISNDYFYSVKFLLIEKQCDTMTVSIVKWLFY
jgi:hypothetical protein